MKNRLVVFIRSLRFQMLAPIVSFLTLLGIASLFLLYSFQIKLSELDKKISSNSMINKAVLEVSQLRSQLRETLLLYVLDPKNSYLETFNSLKIERKLRFSRLNEALVAHPYYHRQFHLFTEGIRETQSLSDKIVEAVQENKLKRATDLFLNYSTLHEINGARLADLADYLETELEKSREQTKAYYTILACIAILLLLAAALAISFARNFYRRKLLNPLSKLHSGLHGLIHDSFPIIAPDKTTAPSEIHEMISDFNRTSLTLKKTQEDLVKAKEDALQAAQIKSDFLSNMSHEIRTPMNAIIGMGDLLNELPLEQEAKEYLLTLRRSSELLLNLVNDILDFSKLESGSIKIESRKVDLHEVVDRIVEVMKPTVTEKGVTFEIAFSSATPSFIKSDPLRLEQILLNLLSNAAKFTHAGKIELKISSFRQYDQEFVKFDVIDTGIGIPPEKLPSLFNRFTQADSSITRKFGGTGLGLAIVKQIVSLMNGSFAVDSELGKGSKFSVTLPIVRTEADSKSFRIIENKNNAFPQQDGNKILVVDDSSDNRFLIKAYLKEAGYHITEARNGVEAVELFKQQKFQLILMDIQMPEMDGCTATATLRSIEKEREIERTPVIALSAYAQQQEVERSLNAGCDLHLTKPVRKVELLETLKLHLKPPNIQISV